MGTIRFIGPDGAEHAVAVRPGNTVMEAAVAAEVPGIEAQCYGAGVCGTCHVYVASLLDELLPAATAWESEMLSALNLVRTESRLACRITFAEALEGATFTIPEYQQAAG